LKFEEILKNKNIDYEMQKIVGPFFVDFYIPSKNLVVEIYGCYPHQCFLCGHDNGAYGKDSREIRYRDLNRIQYIESLGYKTKIIWQHQLFPKKE